MHTYEFVQEFAYQDRTFQVVLRVDYEFVGGAAQDPVVVLDDPTLFGWVHFRGQFNENWSQIQLVSCNFEYLEERVRTILVDNGDRIYLANFDQPLGDVHLIWIDEFSYGWAVNYVDADGQEIESSPYVDAP